MNITMMKNNETKMNKPHINFTRLMKRTITNKTLRWDEVSLGVRLKELIGIKDGLMILILNKILLQQELLLDI